jgi:hypothetical protein
MHEGNLPQFADEYLQSLMIRNLAKRTISGKRFALERLGALRVCPKKLAFKT